MVPSVVQEGPAAARGSQRPPEDPQKTGTALLQCLEIGDDVVDVLRVAHSAIGHAVALHLRLGITDIGAQIVLVPYEIGPLHRVGVAKIGERGRSATEHSLETGSECVGTVGVTGGAGRKQHFAMLSVGRAGMACKECEQKKGRKAHRCSLTPGDGYFFDHACTSGPGLLRYFSVMALADQ